MKRHISEIDHERLTAEIANLAGLGNDELKARWKAAYGTAAPLRMKRDLLRYAVAYRMQERALGGLKPAICRLLDRVADDAAARRPVKATPPARKVGAGAVLVRQWGGVDHEVTVLEEGVLFRGKRHRSLSEVARVITGSRWSGPLFFGLKAPAKECLPMEDAKPSVRRCAVYTRKSSEEGLEQDFNSLHAQREACEAFIKSQAGEGWRLVKTAYDDGGLSGGTMDRPALQRLLDDIRHGLIDVIVVYKVDRLTRSLADFAKMVEIFDAQGVSFVAVTQQFNTTTSMGRLTLNVLLSFAQFEREVTGERIRDKIRRFQAQGYVDGRRTAAGLRRQRTPSYCQRDGSGHRQGDLRAVSGFGLGASAAQRSRTPRCRIEGSSLTHRRQDGRTELFARRALRTPFESDLHR